MVGLSYASVSLFSKGSGKGAALSVPFFLLSFLSCLFFIVFVGHFHRLYFFSFKSRFSNLHFDHFPNSVFPFTFIISFLFHPFLHIFTVFLCLNITREHPAGFIGEHNFMSSKNNVLSSTYDIFFIFLCILIFTSFLSIFILGTSFAFPSSLSSPFHCSSQSSSHSTPAALPSPPVLRASPGPAPPAGNRGGRGKEGIGREGGGGQRQGDGGQAVVVR